VAHLVDEDVRWTGAELLRFSLPDTFEIYTDCPKGHYVVAAGRCANGVWTEVAKVRGYASMHDYVAEQHRRR
jgi:hypothetical protein